MDAGIGRDSQWAKGVGGAERVFSSLLTGLDRAKFAPVAGYLYGGGAGAAALAQGGVELYEQLFRHRADLRGAIKLALLLRRHRIGIVYYNHQPATQFWAVLGARLIGVPVVVGALHYSVRTKRSRAERWSKRALQIGTDHFIALSRPHRALISAELRIPSSRITAICNGVDAEKIVAGRHAAAGVRRSFGIPDSSQVVGILARLVVEKNVELFLRAAADIAKRASGVHFLIIGDGPCRPALERRTGDLEIEHIVHFLGLCDDVAPIINCCDVGVLTSTNEVFPVSVLEFMAASIPTVATDVGSVADIVVDGETGFVVASGDSRTLADRITQLINDPALGVSMGRAGRKRVEERFTVAEMVYRTEALLEDLWERKTGDLKRGTETQPVARSAVPYAWAARLRASRTMNLLLKGPLRVSRAFLACRRRGTTTLASSSTPIADSSILRVRHIGPDPTAPGGIASVLRTYASLQLPGVEFSFTVSWTAGAPLWSIGLWANCARAVVQSARKNDAEIVHVHISHGGSIVREGLLLVLARTMRLGTVATIHGGRFPNSWRRFPWSTRQILRCARVVCVLTDTLQAQLTTAGLQEVRLLPNFVAMPEYATKPSEFGGTVVFAGLVCADKGIHELLAAWASLPHAEDDRLVLVGSLAMPLPILDRSVTYAGVLAHDEVEALLAESRLAVLPSHSEAMPVFVLEAMAFGRPVVATDIAGLGALLQGCGAVVGVGDSGGLASAISRYLQFPDLADQHGSLAREKVATTFSIDSASPLLREVYGSANDLNKKVRPARGSATYH